MTLWAFLLVWSFVLSAPVILVVIVARRRISRRTGCTLLAVAFGAAAAYALWRIEWFDVWRHGTPALSQLFIYACYSAAFGTIGWSLARAMLPNTPGHPANPRA